MLDLFQEGTRVPEFKDWDFYINPRVDRMVSVLLDDTKHKRENSTIYPEQEDILNSFKETSPDNVKVIILGQDPYHDGNATGHAFACKQRLSPSLAQIFNAMAYGEVKMLPDKKLYYLIRQGVMLLNTILTVEAGHPLSHSGIGWEEVISEFLHEFSTKEKHIVYMLWGSHAKAFSKHINNRNNLLLFANHPVSASYNRTNWNCDHFKVANEYLLKNNKQPINWI